MPYGLTVALPLGIYIHIHGLGASLNQPHYLTREEAKVQRWRNKLVPTASSQQCWVWFRSPFPIQYSFIAKATSANSELLVSSVWVSENAFIYLLCLRRDLCRMDISCCCCPLFFGMSEYIELEKQQIDFLQIIQRGEGAGVCAP